MIRIIEEWRTRPDLVAHQGANARAAFENHFTKEQSVDRYYRLLAGEPAREETPEQPVPGGVAA